jgi:hypothetical protein
VHFYLPNACVLEDWSPGCGSLGGGGAFRRWRLVGEVSVPSKGNVGFGSLPLLSSQDGDSSTGQSCLFLYPVVAAVSFRTLG